SNLYLSAERGWCVISDEIYLRIEYDAPAPSALDVASHRDHLIVVNGVSKSGSPAPRSMISRPCAFNAFARWETAIVADSRSATMFAEGWKTRGVDTNDLREGTR
ncbi:MAG: hypothetical protein ACKOH8_10510, partial [Gemmatimonadota bacterium]